MSRETKPGVQQNYKGEYYRTASWPTSSKTVIIPGGHVEVAPFSFRFHSGEGGHIWHYQEGKESRVDLCGRRTCSICGFKGSVPAHRVLIGSSTKLDYIRAGKQIWEGEEE